MLNVIDAVSRKEQSAVKEHLTTMIYAETREAAVKERKKFEQAFQHNVKAVKTVVQNWERLLPVLAGKLSWWV
jgi:transposase-like protein